MVGSWKIRKQEEMPFSHLQQHYITLTAKEKAKNIKETSDLEK